MLKVAIIILTVPLLEEVGSKNMYKLQVIMEQERYKIVLLKYLARFHNISTIFTAYLNEGRTLELLTLKCMLQQSEWKFQEFSDSLCLRKKQGFKVSLLVVWRLFLSVSQHKLLGLTFVQSCCFLLENKLESCDSRVSIKVLL